jgi:hypothetical protein
VRLIRTFGGLGAGLRAEGHGSIVDSACGASPESQAAALSLFEADARLHGDIHDISLGGARVALSWRPPRDHVMSRVVQLDFGLPRVASDAGGPDWMPLRLRLLGLVRDFRETRDACTVHVRFLQRLPNELNVRFEALDRRVRLTAPRSA